MHKKQAQRNGKRFPEPVWLYLAAVLLFIILYHKTLLFASS